MGVEVEYGGTRGYFIFPYEEYNEKGDKVLSNSAQHAKTYALIGNYSVDKVIAVYHTHTAETDHNPGLSGDDLMVSDALKVPNYALDLKRNLIFIYDPSSARDVMQRRNSYKSPYMGYGHEIGPLYLNNRINFELRTY